MENKIEDLSQAIEKMCNETGIERKYFEALPGEPLTLLLKGRYLTTQEALFAVKRWKKIISRFWFGDLRIKAKVVTRKKNKYLSLVSQVGEAPPAD